MERRKIFAAALFLLAGMAMNAQQVRWTGSAEQKDADTYCLTLKAEIPSGYHMYDMGPYQDGPNATTISFTAGEGAALSGSVNQVSTPNKAMDQSFGMVIGSFEQSATFTQDVKLNADGADVSADLEWQICTNSMCLSPADTTITFHLGQTAAAVAEEPQETVASPSTGTERQTESIWSLVVEAILWGFAMLLTPCVFPMVPMTISFFMKGSENKRKGRFKASMYGLFIVLLYTVPISVIILLTRIIGGDAVTASIFNWLATHWLPNLIFFVVFMIFAASFFGAFEITLPSSIVNKSDANSDRKGLLGVFFMALTLVLVSFSCTGPIVGTVLIKSTSGEFWAPMVTMLAFSVAFALPFTILALFPSLLKNLPKSGGWLNSVKVVLGFIEVALGFKFLSTADQTYHWGLLDREVYLAIWIVCFSMMGFYLLGKLRFANDDKLEHISVKRLGLAIAVFSFVVYMIPGMWGAPLKALSGYLPPIETQDFVLGSEAPAATVTTVSSTPSQGRKYSDFLTLPHNLDGFFDLEEAREYAAQAGKPVFVDVTGHGCVNCREMEARVWSDPRVLEILRNDYVICALYADDKKEVSEEDWVTTDNGKVLKSLGKINSYYALKEYNVNSQPCYVLESPDGKRLQEPRGYNLDVEDFISFLRSGLEAYYGK